ncbi:porin family protein [Mesoflavibacter zeaxanthinifaciens]|uniref:porin family protein n=1 Tax=Mesoflavibacter zeaxanthinifaciens TaxID=393060 RepID=UPI003A90E7CC
MKNTKYFSQSIICLLICFLTSNSLSAQFHLGAKAGANLTKIDSQSYDDNFELGFQVGGFVYYDFSDFMGIQAEVLFNQTNTKVTDEFSDVFDDAFDKNKTLNYISVPLLLRLNSGGLITINAGPQFSFLADGNETVLANGKKLFKDTDFSAVAGLELNLHPVIISARYIWGFTDISDVGDKANSHQIQLGVGLRLF